MDVYGSFRELVQKEVEGVDWDRVYRPRGSRILIMAPHGGWIEPLTTELASDLAGGDFSLYLFRGLRGREGRSSLHITSHRFDEPLALRAAEEAEWVVAVHGERTRDGAFLMLGGRWREGVARLGRSLEEAGFQLREPRTGLRGLDPANICNRGRARKGGQLEVSEGLRRRLEKDPGLRARFLAAVRGVLLELEGEDDGHERRS